MTPQKWKFEVPQRSLRAIFWPHLFRTPPTAVSHGKSAAGELASRNGILHQAVELHAGIAVFVPAAKL
jgi:hypothetical protein